jgi:hypothetical protein
MAREQSYSSAGLICALVAVPIVVALSIPAYLSGHYIEVMASWTALGLISLVLSLRGHLLTRSWDHSRALAAAGITIGALESLLGCIGLLIVITHAPFVD